MTIQEKEMLITQITMLLNSLTTDEAPQTEEKNSAGWFLQLFVKCRKTA